MKPSRSAAIGVAILLFEIFLDTDLRRLPHVGGAAATAAVVGVTLRIVLGHAAGRLLGLNDLVAVWACAALTATTVGITVRVLSDLGRLRNPESQLVPPCPAG